MRIRIDNILLCILWLLAVILGTCFWFNTIFGFDIFSAAHWEYISSLQASHAPIKTSFYVSVAITIFITIFGIYLIVQPRMRKIRLPIMKVSKHEDDQKKEAIPQSNSDASTLDILPAEVQETHEEAKPSVPASSVRPPRLIMPTFNNNFISTQPLPTQTQPIIQVKEEDILELKNIFINAGYTVKPNATINGKKTHLIAVGTNETMWLGCIGLKTTDVRSIIDRLQQIFSDTLETTEIEVNGFVIGAPDASTSEFQDILMFNDIAELREYMKDRQNPPLPPDDDGLFDAYSQYINVVIANIGNI